MVDGELSLGLVLLALALEQPAQGIVAAWEVRGEPDGAAVGLLGGLELAGCLERAPEVELDLDGVGARPGGLRELRQGLLGPALSQPEPPEIMPQRGVGRVLLNAGHEHRAGGLRVARLLVGGGEQGEGRGVVRPEASGPLEGLRGIQRAFLLQ